MFRFLPGKTFSAFERWNYGTLGKKPKSLRNNITFESQTKEKEKEKTKNKEKKTVQTRVIVIFIHIYFDFFYIIFVQFSLVSVGFHRGFARFC